jgi:hypothetical protein
METIFAKAPAGQAHHYTLLLKRKQLKNTASENCFAKSIGNRDHLYTPKGVNKGHRRALSVQQEVPNTETVSSAPVLFKSETKHKVISRSPVTSLLENELQELKKANFELDLERQNLECEVIRLKKLLDIERKVLFM